MSWAIADASGMQVRHNYRPVIERLIIITRIFIIEVGVCIGDSGNSDGVTILFDTETVPEKKCMKDVSYTIKADFQHKISFSLTSL